MSELTWASDMLRTRVAPANSDQYVETRIRNAAKAIGWSFSRTRDIWYKDDRVAVRPRELRQIEEYTGLRYGRQELSELDILIARADALLVGNQDKNFYRSFADGLRALAGALDSARTRDGGSK
jgi:hypothetical protein